jgi:sirohydrochlorin ferrochelatase
MRHPRLSAAAGTAQARAGRARRQAVPPLLAVAHGSADPRAAATIAGLMALVGEMAGRDGLPVLDARTAYLGHSPPSVAQVLGALAGTPPAAQRRAVVVLPLLLTAAYHSEIDLPALLAEASGAHPGLSISYGDPLGPHPLLLGALDRRLAECGAPVAPGMANPGITRPAWPLPGGRRFPHAGPVPSSPGDIAVVLAAAGSRRPAASAAIGAVAARWQAARGWRTVVPAYAAAGSPTPADAVSALLRGGAPAVVVATYLLAPGRFADQVAESSLRAGAAAVSGALGAAPEVARVVLLRYAAAVARPGRVDAVRQGMSASR